MSIRVEGINFGGLVERIDAVTPEALTAAGEVIGKLAQENAPLLVDMAKANQDRRANPGALRESMYVSVVDGVTAEVGFSEFYAAWQHERMDYHHDEGAAKFLEHALMVGKEAAVEVIAVEVRKAIGL